MTKLLDVDALVAGYGAAVAVDAVTFHVDRGEFVTFIGPNGAGKTTLLNTIMGAIAPLAGRIRFAGEDLRTLAPETRVGRGIVIVPERRELFAGLTVEDHLRLGAYLRRHEGQQRLSAALDKVYELLPRLKERRRQLAGTLSGGEQQMVAIGRALMSAPKLLMLDEPSTGLAPRIVEEIFITIDKLKADGMTGILVEQNANLALSIADRGFVLEVGNVVASGASADLKRDPRVLAAYLGAGDRYRDVSQPHGIETSDPTKGSTT